MEYFNNLNELNYSKILSGYDYYLSKTNNGIQYELVIVLSVFKRNNLENQLIQISRQSFIESNKDKKINIIIFKNSNHLDINNVIKKWNMSNIFSEKVKINYINSPFEIGNFWRFLVPLTSPVTTNA